MFKWNPATNKRLPLKKGSLEQNCCKVQKIQVQNGFVLHTISHLFFQRQPSWKHPKCYTFHTHPGYAVRQNTTVSSWADRICQSRCTNLCSAGLLSVGQREHTKTKGNQTQSHTKTSEMGPCGSCSYRSARPAHSQFPVPFAFAGIWLKKEHQGRRLALHQKIHQVTWGKLPVCHIVCSKRCRSKEKDLVCAWRVKTNSEKDINTTGKWILMATVLLKQCEWWVINLSALAGTRADGPKKTQEFNLQLFLNHKCRRFLAHTQIPD